MQPFNSNVNENCLLYNIFLACGGTTLVPFNSNLNENALLYNIFLALGG